MRANQSPLPPAERNAPCIAEDKQRNFFRSRRWETGCGDHPQPDETPDRLVFLVSLLILPFVLLV